MIPSRAAGLLCLGLLVGCSPAQSPADATVTIDGRTFAVQVRDTAAGRAEGLSGRPEVPAGTGMLFTYPDRGVRSYWMSGMLIDIDLAWIVDDRVAGVQTLPRCQDPQPCPSYPSPVEVDAVLEVAAGALADVQPGAEVIIER